MRRMSAMAPIRPMAIAHPPNSVLREHALAARWSLEIRSQGALDLLDQGFYVLKGSLGYN